MSDAVVVAVIGAVATVATAVIAALPNIIKKRRAAVRTAKPASYTFEAMIIGAAMIAAAATIVFGSSRRDAGAATVPTSTAPLTRATAAVEPAEFQRLIDAAKLQQKFYVVDTIVMHVRLEDVQASRRQQRRRAHVRAVYNVRALKDFSEDDDSFVEQFTSSIKDAPALHWFGNRREFIHNDDGSIYSVRIAAREGDRFTVVTGVTFEYTLPYPADRTAPAEVARLGPNQDYWVYPNREDFVGELTLILESPTTMLQPMERGAIRVTNNQPKLADVFVGERVGAKPEQRSLSYSWQHLRPGERVGILYRW